MKIELPDFNITIPAAASEKISKTHKNGQKAESEYYYEHHKVGYRSWNDKGIIQTEIIYLDPASNRIVKYFDGNGEISWYIPFANNNIEGVTIQWHRYNGEIHQHYYLTKIYYRSQKMYLKRIWEANGQLSYEAKYKNGKLHGTSKRWYDNGALMWESEYYEGNEHGTARQWNDQGELLGTYTMENGTGIDLWWDEDGKLREERQLKDGSLHGLERYWKNKKNIFFEQNFHNDLLHGIKRVWDDNNLSPGYPEFYLKGKKVSKTKYLEHTKKDPTLPPYIEKEDKPARKSLV